jgi:hypothetical protein
MATGTSEGKVKLTKDVIDEIKKKLDSLEGKEIDADHPFHIQPHGVTARDWTISYKTDEA